MYLKEGTYHTRLFGGPSTNGMKSGMVLAAPGPLLTVTTSLFLPRINIGADVWGESSIMTGVY